MNTLTLFECIELAVVCLGSTFVSCPKVLAMSQKVDFYRDNGAFASPSERILVSPKLKEFWGEFWYYTFPKVFAMPRKIGLHRRGNDDLTRYRRGEYFGENSY